MPLADDLRYLIEYDILKVLRILDGLVADLPRSYEARILLGDAYLRGLRFQPALEQYAAAAKLAPNARSPQLKIALCQIYTGQYQAALAGLERLHGRARDDHALALAGLMLHRLGRPADALARWRTLTESTTPTNSDVMFGLQGLMLALRDTGRLLEADHAASQLLNLLDQRRGQDQTDQAPVDLHALNTSYDYHEWSLLADKGGLAALLARHTSESDGSTGDRRFFPETFILPEERQQFVAFAAGQPSGTVYIIKPRNGQGGQSIQLTDQIDIASAASDAVVQRYIDPPYLIDGKKAHLRIYTLVVGSQLPRVYVYQDGIARFAPEQYHRKSGWLASAGIHVTNTALHRHHPQMVISNDPSKEDVGNIWSLRAYLARIGADGHDPNVVFTAIMHLVGRFVEMLHADGMFDRQQRMGPRRSFVPKLFGMDILLDNTARPWLIEIQRSPAWNGPPLVKRINNTLANTLARMNIGRLLSDDMPPTAIAAILTDPAALARREQEIEFQNRGLFVRLKLSSMGSKN